MVATNDSYESEEFGFNISSPFRDFPRIFFQEESISHIYSAVDGGYLGAEEDEEWRASLLALYGVLSLSLFAIFTGSVINFVILYKIFKRRKLLIVTNVFSAYLSIANLTFQFTLVATYLVLFCDASNFDENSAVVVLLDCTYQISILVTGFILMVMSYSRYRMVARPLKSRVEWAPKRAWIYCLLCFIAAVILVVPFEFVRMRDTWAESKDRNSPNGRLVGVFNFGCQFLLPLTWVLCCYIKLNLIFRRGRFNQVLGASDGSRVVTNQRVIAQNRRLLKVTVVVVTVYAFTWGPIQVLTLMLYWSFRLEWYEFTIYVSFLILAVIGGCIQSMLFGWKTLKYSASRIGTSS